MAEAIREAFRQLFGDTLHVYFSTSEELRGGIRPGRDWYQWIVERVLERGDERVMFLIGALRA